MARCCICDASNVTSARVAVRKFSTASMNLRRPLNPCAVWYALSPRLTLLMLVATPFSNLSKHIVGLRRGDSYPRGFLWLPPAPGPRSQMDFVTAEAVPSPAAATPSAAAPALSASASFASWAALRSLFSLLMACPSRRLANHHGKPGEQLIRVVTRRVHHAVVDSLRGLSGVCGRLPNALHCSDWMTGGLGEPNDIVAPGLIQVHRPLAGPAAPEPRTSHPSAPNRRTG